MGNTISDPGKVTTIKANALDNLIQIRRMLNQSEILVTQGSTSQLINSTNSNDRLNNIIFNEGIKHSMKGNLFSKGKIQIIKNKFNSNGSYLNILNLNDTADDELVEDILNFIGFMEDKNYIRQSQVESGEKPDYTFLLPKEKKLNMDVKFPLASYERYIHSELEEERDAQKKEFLKDVKNHIKTVASREYVNPAEGTVDYVLLFIPNESIYGFINQEDTDLIDFALKKKVLLCSPLTLYAMLSLIYQATRNFAMEEKATEVMNLLNAFRLQWDKYVEVMDKMGRSLETAKKDYDTLVTTRKSQLEKPLSQIEEITSGGEVAELAE